MTKYPFENKIVFSIAIVCSAIALLGTELSNAQELHSTPTLLTPPPWAYAVNPPPVAGAARVVRDSTPRSVPDSEKTFTLTQIADLFNVPDWFPGDHPTLPISVAFGRKPVVYACGYCHLPNGQGRPENAGLAGMPASYIIQQTLDIKSGVRKTSGPMTPPHSAMLAAVSSATDQEVHAAAEYFSQLKFKSWIRVVETKTVPATRVAGFMLVPVSNGKSEAIGSRIIEIPEDVTRTELRDSHSGFIAYVPVGSINRGAALVTKGGAGKTIRCGICHGPDLKGLAFVPAIAGRSPSYIVRQLYDMKNGTRHGIGSELMREVVSQLTADDIVAIAAYTSSRNP